VTVLEATSLTKRFGGILALSDVSLRIDESELVAVIGPNGAGKTTLFDCLLGTTRPDSGSVLLDGRDITNLPVHRRARLGMARTFQRVELFSELTVRQNLIVAARARRQHRGLVRDLIAPTAERPEEQARVNSLLSLLGLDEDADRQAQVLSLGRARLVELARALATDPSVVLADEPSSGLDDADRHTLVQALTSVRAGGTSVLLVEHDLDLVRAVADRVYVLSAGLVLTEGHPATTLDSAAVEAAYRAGVDR